MWTCSRVRRKGFDVKRNKYDADAAPTPTVNRVTDPTHAAEGVRQRNLARLLRLVHLEGPLSRATLTEATGLNRSTIADLVVELVRAGPRRGARARPLPPRRPALARRRRQPATCSRSRSTPRSTRSRSPRSASTAASPLRERIDVDHLLTPDETAALVAERIDRWRAGALARRAHRRGRPRRARTRARRRRARARRARTCSWIGRPDPRPRRRRRPGSRPSSATTRASARSPSTSTAPRAASTTSSTSTAARAASAAG